MQARSFDLHDAEVPALATRQQCSVLSHASTLTFSGIRTRQIRYTPASLLCHQRTGDNTVLLTCRLSTPCWRARNDRGASGGEVWKVLANVDLAGVKKQVQDEEGAEAPSKVAVRLVGSRQGYRGPVRRRRSISKPQTAAFERRTCRSASATRLLPFEKRHKFSQAASKKTP